MAITHGGASTSWTSGTANIQPSLPATYNAGDLLICVYGTKPYNDAPTIDQGWTDLGSGTSGTNGSGIDSGSMQIRIFYKIATSGTETAPTITNTTNSVSGAVIHRFVLTGGTYEWVTPVMATGSDTTSGTALSVACGSGASLAAGDYVLVGVATNSDASGDVTSGALSCSGCTFGTVTNTPSTDLATSSGQDMGATTWYASVSTGPSSGNPTFTATLAGSVTEAAGAIVRIREQALVYPDMMPYIGGGYYG